VDAPAHNAALNLSGLAYFRKRESNVRPYVDFGAAAIWYTPTGALKSTVVGGTFVAPVNPLQTKLEPAMTYGVGLKFNANRFIGFRVEMRNYWSFQPHFGLPNAPAGFGTLYVPARGTASSIGIEAGVTLRLGYHAPPPPVVVAPPPPPPPPPPALTISSISGGADVCPGDNLTLRVTASGGPPSSTPTYQWTVNGQPAAGATSATFNVPTAGGSGTVSVGVTANSGGMTASASPVTIRYRTLGLPTVSVSAAPGTIPYGQTSQITGNANGSECGGPARITYSASEGSISGTTFNSNGVSFDMSNRLREQSKVVTITATATDQRNQTARATTNVTVTLTPEARRLDDIVFQPRSARVNNCGKRLLLEELTPMLRADPGAKVILIGHRDGNEAASLRLDEKRTLNAAAILSAGKGICPSLDLSRVYVHWVGTDQTDQTRPALCGSSANVRERSGQAIRESDTRAQYRRVEIWFVPSGADMPPGTSGYTTAPDRETKALGCPR
jgi:outer membrane protein OmpA-like peptidoglycan-associated protein